MKLVNIVSVGSINRELDLEPLSQNIRFSFVDYSPSNFPGIIMRASADSPTVCLFTSGKFTITGASSRPEVEEVENSLKNELYALSIIGKDTNLTTNIVNMVYSEEIELDMNLEEVSMLLGFENTEYEPEVSPFVIYRPESSSCVITVSSSGRVVVTGVTSEETAESVLSELITLIKNRD
jgi:transcription initiation factor TFIID TATA-box-binding protein